jgi:hypothetical protein
MPFPGYVGAMSTVQEIEAAIPRLSRAELQQLRAWFEDYLEGQLELTDEVKAKLDQSRQEIAAGAGGNRLSRRLRELSAKVSGLPSDLAERHDYYLHHPPKRSKA